MAKKAKTAPEVNAVNSVPTNDATLGRAIAKAIGSGDQSVNKASLAVNAAQVSQMESLQAAIAGAGPINDKRWDATIGPAYADAIKPFYPDPKTAAATASYAKIAAIGLSHATAENGLRPNAKESLRKYVTRIRDMVKAQGLYTSKTGGGAKAKAKSKPTTVADTRAMTAADAIAFLADGDAVMAQCLHWVFKSDENKATFRTEMSKHIPA